MYIFKNIDWTNFEGIPFENFSSPHSQYLVQFRVNKCNFISNIIV